MRTVLDADFASGDIQKDGREIAHAGLDAAANVHDVVDRFGIAGEKIRARDISDVDEVDRGRAVVLQEFARAGLRDIRVGVIFGDDVLALVRELDPKIPDLGVTAGQLGDDLLSANAYLGAAPIVECLEAGAQFVLGGRIADAALFGAPVMHHFGWDSKDWDRAAHATLVGHILECGTQSTGGYFADPPWREVPNLANLGNPYIEVNRDSGVVTKLPGTGGLVDRRTVALQVAYEVQDPRAYLTPDVTADFADVVCEEVGSDRVRFSGAHGRPAPETTKVMVAVDRGYRAVAEISYAASGCLERAQLAIEVLQNSLDHLASDLEEVRFDIVGVKTSNFGRQGARRVQTVLWEVPGLNFAVKRQRVRHFPNGSMDTEETELMSLRQAG